MVLPIAQSQMAAACIYDMARQSYSFSTELSDFDWMILQW